MRWQQLQQNFMALVKLAHGPMKSSCGTVTVSYGNPYNNYGVDVTFGGYCIGNWGRQEIIGPFETEDQAYKAAVQKLEEGRNAVQEVLEND